LHAAYNVFLFRYGEKQRRADNTELSGIQLLSATAYQLKKPNQQLLIPITVWIGMEQAFIGADFTQVGTRTIDEISGSYGGLHENDCFRG
jgi:hypothetical protein